LVVRQDRFLYIAVATLLHLAEDPSVQRKMKKKVRPVHCCYSYARQHRLLHHCLVTAAESATEMLARLAW
jgi:hypothetical protein